MVGTRSAPARSTPSSSARACVSSRPRRPSSRPSSTPSAPGPPRPPCSLTRGQAPTSRRWNGSSGRQHRLLGPPGVSAAVQVCSRGPSSRISHLWHLGRGTSVQALERRVYSFARLEVSSPDHLSRGIGISMRYQYLLKPRPRPPPMPLRSLKSMLPKIWTLGPPYPRI